MKLYCLLILTLQVFNAKSSHDDPNQQRSKRGLSRTLLDDPACSTAKRFCNNPQRNDDLSILECLHSLHPDDLATLAKDCQQVVWSATSDLIKDQNVMDTLRPMCHNDIDQLNCQRDQNNDMAYFKCLATNKENIANAECQEMVRRIENVAFTDYKFLANFLKQCETDVKDLKCGSIDTQGLPQIGTIACLQNNILKVKDECKKEVFKLSELQADNIRLDQQLFLDCAEDYSR